VFGVGQLFASAARLLQQAASTIVLLRDEVLELVQLLLVSPPVGRPDVPLSAQKDDIFSLLFMFPLPLPARPGTFLAWSVPSSLWNFLTTSCPTFFVY
jgi:hypothetical protein